MDDGLRTALHAAQEMARASLRPEADRVDAEYRWPEENVRALQRELGGLVVPDDAGGMGLGMLALVQVSEILARECPSTALCFGMHCVGTAVIAAKADDDQRERYLEPIARGEHLTTLALSEPGTGSEFWIPQLRTAPQSPDTFVLDGTKSFVTSGGHADSYVISAATDAEDAGLGEFSCFVLPGDAPGLRWGDEWRGIGMRGNSSRTVEIRGTTLTRAHLLGKEGDQVWYVFNVIAPYFLSSMSGVYLGIATAALEEARVHVMRRTHAHRGDALARRPLVQHRLGELWAIVERTRRLVYYAAAQGDAQGEDAILALCSAKAEVAECAVTVVNEAMTLTGGVAYREGSRLERMLRDVRAAHVMAPTTDQLRTWVGRALLGEPLLAE